MTNPEFSNQFDVLYNNVMSNAAPGLNEYEKSVFLTRAQDELTLNYFNPKSKGNAVQEGFDESAIRQMNFSNLIRSQELAELQETPKTDPRAIVFNMPTDAYIIINEQIYLKDPVKDSDLVTQTIASCTKTDNGWVCSSPTSTGLQVMKVSSAKAGTVTGYDGLKGLSDVTVGSKYDVTQKLNTSEVKGTRQVIPISYQEYMRLMSKPFKEPLKWQAWRLLTDVSNTLKAEIVLTSHDKNKYPVRNYNIRYVKKPQPIILVDIDTTFGEKLTIGGLNKETQCELNESVHEAILQRAVELAKASYAADQNGQIQFKIQQETAQKSE